MPGSATTPGHTSACDGAPVRVAIRDSDGVGTRIESLRRLNGWPARTSVNASRCTTDDSGTTWFACCEGLAPFAPCRAGRSPPRLKAHWGGKTIENSNPLGIQF